MREDYYQLLDAEPTASKQELRTAYRRMAKRYHPDHNAGDPAAEERFKLVAEAWRTLGDEAKRADYDSWLERRRRYASMPEMKGMPRHTRMTVHRDRSERRRNSRPASARRVVRPFLLRHSNKVSGWQFVIIGLCFLSAMVPYFRYQFSIIEKAAPSATPEGHRLAPGESPLPLEEQKRNLENYLHRVVAAAEAGDAEAQYRYGFFLYLGVGGVQQNREAAREWWEKAAAQGNQQARQNLLKLRQEAPASPRPSPEPPEETPASPEA